MKLENGKFPKQCHSSGQMEMSGPSTAHSPPRTDLQSRLSDRHLRGEVEYKYVRLNGDGEVLEWSPGKNRTLQLEHAVDDMIMDDDWDASTSKITSKAAGKDTPKKSESSAATATSETVSVSIEKIC